MQILLLGFLYDCHVLNIEIKIKDLFRFFIQIRIFPQKNCIFLITSKSTERTSTP
jgi:hypothetical protein